jgi:hypothetical protein
VTHEVYIKLDEADLLDALLTLLLLKNVGHYVVSVVLQITVVRELDYLARLGNLLLHSA